MISGVFSSLAGVGFASFLIFYRDRAKHQVVFVNSGFIAASFMYSQLHYSFGMCLSFSHRDSTRDSASARVVRLFANLFSSLPAPLYHHSQ